MENKPLISVIVPVYNVQKYIRQCLNSIILQTYRNLEIILIDDGSKDASLKIIREYEKKDNRIKVLTQKNEGVSKTRNKGIALSKGDYISFIDSDDYISLSLYQKFVNSINNAKTNPDLFCFNISFYFEKQNLENIGAGHSFDIRDWQNRKDENTIHTFDDCTRPFSGNLSSCNKIFKRSFLVGNNLYFPDRRCFEDFQFSFFCLLAAKSIILTNERLYSYRKISKNSLTRNYNTYVFDIFDVNKQIENKLKAMGQYENYKYAFFQHKYRQYAFLFFQANKKDRVKFFINAKIDLKTTFDSAMKLEIVSQLRDFNICEDFLTIDEEIFYQKYKNKVIE